MVWDGLDDVWGGLEVVWGGLGCFGVVWGVSTDPYLGSIIFFFCINLHSFSKEQLNNAYLDVLRCPGVS